MNILSVDTPVLLIMFNRPEHGRQLLERLSTVRPTKIYIAIDGPRNGHLADPEKVRETVNLINTIDWPCVVKTLIREQNLGCKRAVSSAIDWFFEHVEQGIILEDDCLPDPTFFNFCHVLLDKYAEDNHVMHLGGVNFYGDNVWSESSFIFSKIVHIWGWATWRRAWMLYDADMSDYPAFREAGGIENTVTYPASQSYWRDAFDNTYAGRIDTWDYQWVFTIWRHGGVSIIPSQNLITNIGFGEDATHTVVESEYANMPTNPIDADKIVYPVSTTVNQEAMDFAFAKFYQLPPWWRVKVSSLKRRLIGRMS